MGAWLKVSSDRQEKPRIPGLQGERLINYTWVASTFASKLTSFEKNLLHFPPKVNDVAPFAPLAI